MATDKIIRRVENLLRLAAPSSNSTYGERANAAIEAARLIEEHGISLATEKKPDEKKKVRVATGVWVLSRALQYCSCNYCNKLISRGDIVYICVVNPGDVRYRHNMHPCSPT